MKYCPNCKTEMETKLMFARDRPVCPNCHFIFFKGPKVATGVIVGHEGKVLMTQRDIDPGRGRWALPAGYVDADEDVAEAARREVREETGLEVCIDGVLGVYSNVEGGVVLIVYRGTIVAGEPLAGDETQAVGMFSPSDLPDLAFEQNRSIIQDWVKHTGKLNGGSS